MKFAPPLTYTLSKVRSRTGILVPLGVDLKAVTMWVRKPWDNKFITCHNTILFGCHWFERNDAHYSLDIESCCQYVYLLVSYLRFLVITIIAETEHKNVRFHYQLNEPDIVCAETYSKIWGNFSLEHSSFCYDF